MAIALLTLSVISCSESGGADAEFAAGTGGASTAGSVNGGGAANGGASSGGSAGAEQQPNGFLFASGAIVTYLDGRLLRMMSPADLSTINSWQPPSGDAFGLLGGDDEDIFMLYHVADAPDYTIARFDRTTTEQLSSSPEQPYSSDGDMAVAEDRLYYPAGSKSLSAARHEPSEPSTLVDVVPNSPWFVMVDALNVYWVDQTGIHSVPRFGEVPSTSRHSTTALRRRQLSTSSRATITSFGPAHRG